jgi:prophage antirepressor-like protein
MIPQQNRERQLFPLTFQQHTVRTVLIDGVPWFVANDVCDVLGLGNPAETLRNYPENEKGISSTDTHGGKQGMLTVNEPGLYRLIFQSRKPEAEQFKTWVFTAVLPQIRQTGFFFPDPAKLDEQQLTLTITRYFASKRPNKNADLEIGKCLVYLKNCKRHGEFLPCLTAMGIKHRNAARYMQNFHKHEQRELLKQQNLFEPSVGKLSAPPWYSPFKIRQLPLLRFFLEPPLLAVY